MLYSVRMRAAQGGAHENGGRHISGAERLVNANDISAAASAMVERALSHSRGQAEFINIQVDIVPTEQIKHVPLLPIRTFEAQDYRQGRDIALDLLQAAGVDRQAAHMGVTQLQELDDSLRGAMLLCAQTGQRLDRSEKRGIRVSRMDSEDPMQYSQFLEQKGLGGTHAREAMVLAAKVISAQGVVAELCWSDDPEYTAGYVASSQGYMRITQMKKLGSLQGGRVFFIKPDTPLAELEQYLEMQPVLVAPTPNRG